MSTHESTVKWFDAKKGYGFLDHPEGGSDIFVHYTQIRSDEDFKTLSTGQTVRFELNDGPKGLHALNVVALSDPPPDPTPGGSAAPPSPGSDRSPGGSPRF
jgi:CspA family cold shock protein